MELNPEQISVVTAWVKSGASLSEVQKQLESELNIRMTYMEVRFLVDDLELDLKAPPPKFDDPARDLSATPSEPGKVSVSLDKITRPDALISGEVTFSDGETAQWYLDQTGRLGLNPKTPGYKPAQEDVADFQAELQKAVESKGMM